LRPCAIQCHGELRLAVSYSGHPSVCPLPLCCARSTFSGAVLAQSEPRCRRPEAPSVPEFALEVSNLPMPLFRQVPHRSPRNCSPELAAPPRNLFHRGLRYLAPPCRFCAHGCVHRDVLNVSVLFPKPLEPRRGRSARLRRTPVAGPSGATTPKSVPLSLDLGRTPEIGRFRLNPSRSDRSPPIQIQPSLLSPPHPRLCPWARPVSPPWLAGALASLVSRAHAPAPAHVRVI
jgi:hypothetical protein